MAWRFIDASPSDWILKPVAWFAFGCLIGYALLQAHIVLIHVVRKFRKTDATYRRSSTMHQRRCRQHLAWGAVTGVMIAIAVIAIPAFLFVPSGWIVSGAALWFACGQFYQADNHHGQAKQCRKNE